MKIRFLILLTLLASILFGLQDFSRLYSFDDPGEIGFIVPLEGEGSYYYLQDGGIQQSALETWQTGWKQGAIPQPGYIGFRTLDDALVSPVWADTQPPLAAFTPLLEDDEGDHLFTNPVLDILSLKIAATDERLYFAMQVAGNAFPTSSGFTYFAYMPVIVDPSADPEGNPTVYGLMFTVELGVLISPGLYKVTGTGFDGLTRLGDIQHSIEDNVLILSCAMADLLADADFSTWFDPQYPVFATTATTSRINLVNGIQQADMTAGINVLYTPQYLDGANLSAPVLSNANIEIGDGAYKIIALIDYQDQDHNVPRLARVRIDDLQSYPLTPVGELDFAMPVSYKSEELEFPGNWGELTFEFSDGEGTQEFIYPNPVSVSDETLVPAAAISLHPNPVRSSLYLKSQSPEPQQLRLFNLRGQLLREIIVSKGETELDLSSLSS
ncbi:MAG: T9SS type A sorting domain-containing protein, partial [Candidatus Cloacimonetes bacterium]|nr:T9SS type A sorting domain-containing protein [Candidatus Cloacimonadota bacterium]MCK9185678.1 T9SS type A sorting domain-containing protein [Candidatus Cloacimonadota bacterium]